MDVEADSGEEMGSGLVDRSEDTVSEGSEPKEFSVPEVFQMVGYLTVAIPELHSVHPGDVAMKLSEAMDIVREA